MSSFIPEKQLGLIVSHWIRLWESIRLKITQNVWTSNLSKVIISFSKTDLYFDETLVSPKLKVKINRVTNKDSSYACIFCKHLINSGSHHWKLKLWKWNPYSWTFSIGISKPNNCHLSDCISGYGISCQSNPYGIATLDPNRSGSYSRRIGEPLEKNDFLDIFIHFEHNTFYVLKNNHRLYHTKEQPNKTLDYSVKLEKIYKYVKQDYRFGISFYSLNRHDNSIEMITYDYDTLEDYKRYNKVFEKNEND